MKKLATFIAVFIMMLFFNNTFALQKYYFDPAHTYALWQVNHFGFSTISGKFMAQGIIIFNEAHPDNSKVYVRISIESLSTGHYNFDQTLKDVTFFDTARYPFATFVSGF